VAHEVRERPLVVGVDERTDGVRPPRQARKRRNVVGLDQHVRQAQEFIEQRALARQRRQDRGGHHHLLAGTPQQCGGLGDEVMHERPALGADDVAEADSIDVGLLGHAAVEGGPVVGGPVKQDGAKGERDRRHDWPSFQRQDF